MSTILKQCLGIDVSKHTLSLSLGGITEGLEKHFTPHADEPNTQQGFEAVGNWLKEQVDEKADIIVVMEATGVYHQGAAHCGIGGRAAQAADTDVHPVEERTGL